MKKILCYFDGMCEPVNPGGTAGFGAVVFIDNERVWECSRVFKPIPGREHETSNNVAEYSGFLAILQYLLENKLDGESVTIKGDSKLVIEQMQGHWKMRKGFYKPIAHEAKIALKRFSRHPNLVWIPREENGIADELSKAEVKKAGVTFRIQPEA
jgi:ribonuclease HI